MLQTSTLTAQERKRKLNPKQAKEEYIKDSEISDLDNIKQRTSMKPKVHSLKRLTKLLFLQLDEPGRVKTQSAKIRNKSMNITVKTSEIK